MKINDYIHQKKELYSSLFGFINNESISDPDDLLTITKDYEIQENNEKLKEFLYLISSLLEHHHNENNFINKIEQILLNLEKPIKKNITNSEIFRIFQNNKKILLFLFESNVLINDESVAQLIIEKDNITSDSTNQFFFIENSIKYSYYFYPEIIKFMNNDKKKNIKNEILYIDQSFFEDFETKRHKGENDFYLAELIRNDSVEEFISYVNRNNIPIKWATIKSSIFETNSFLIGKEPTLIEYATFYGSIQIFQYLKYNKVPLDPSLWIYAIHSKNSELIHLLEEYQVTPEDKTYVKCFIESVKCHHNDIANYIKDNLMSQNISNESNYDINDNVFHYHNYDFFPDDFSKTSNFFIHHFIEYNYLFAVKIILNTEELDLNEAIILI